MDYSSLAVYFSEGLYLIKWKILSYTQKDFGKELLIPWLKTQFYENVFVKATYLLLTVFSSKINILLRLMWNENKAPKIDRTGSYR